MSQPDYFHVAIEQAKRYRDSVIASSIQPTACHVELTVIGPDGVRVPCGSADFPRCDADVFERGVLTITSQDTGFVMREYQPGQWTDVTVFGSDGHIQYHLCAAKQRVVAC